MPQTTITLSFAVAALVPDELPGPEALRSAVQDELHDDWWSAEGEHRWWLQGINTTPPQRQSVNTQLVEALEKIAHQAVAGIGAYDEGSGGVSGDFEYIEQTARAAIAAASTTEKAGS